MNKMMKKSREDLSGKPGLFPRGEKNSITDVRGVRVGHLTVIKDFKNQSGNRITVRTGLTAVLPCPMEEELRLFYGNHILGSSVEVTGYEVTDDYCYLNSPIVMTNSFNVGTVYNAILSYGFALKRVEIWPPVVVGINDSYLNDMNQYSLDEKEILETFQKAEQSKIEEGSVGIGVGLKSFGWKGGIGNSSRLLSLGEDRYTLGVLVASNHGNKPKDKKSFQTMLAGEGSLIAVIATDISLLPHQIKRILQSLAASLASRYVLKNLRDSIAFLMFSTANPMSMKEDGPFVFNLRAVDDSFTEQIILAGSKAIQEAILNSLQMAKPVQGRYNRKLMTIPEEELVKLKINPEA